MLGLDKKASQEDIKKAYKRLALKYHPDKNGGQLEQFQKISEAYNILGDVEKKAAYDMKSNNMGDTSSSFMHILSILISYLVEKQKRKQEEASNNDAPSSRHDIRLSVSVGLTEVYNGNTKKITLNTKSYNGVVTTKNIYISLVGIQKEYIFENEGDEYLPGKHANIIITVTVNEHEYVKRDMILSEYDLYVDQTMTLYEYYNGVKRKVTFMNDEILDIECEAYMYNQEFTFVKKIQGKGLPEEDSEGFVRGDLYVYFKLDLPTEIDTEMNNVLKNHFNKR